MRKSIINIMAMVFVCIFTSQVFATTASMVEQSGNIIIIKYTDEMTGKSFNEVKILSLDETMLLSIAGPKNVYVISKAKMNCNVLNKYTMSDYARVRFDSDETYSISLYGNVMNLYQMTLFFLDAEKVAKDVKTHNKMKMEIKMLDGTSKVFNLNLKNFNRMAAKADIF